jgi:hypothetical protein
MRPRQPRREDALGGLVARAKGNGCMAAARHGAGDIFLCRCAPEWSRNRAASFDAGTGAGR